MNITTKLHPNSLFPIGTRSQELLNGWNIDEGTGLTLKRDCHYRPGFSHTQEDQHEPIKAYCLR
jgi:hypothetical protein